MFAHGFLGPVVATAATALLLSLGGCAATRPSALVPGPSETLASTRAFSPSAGFGDRIGSQVFPENSPALSFYLAPRPLLVPAAVARVPQPILRIPPTMTTASDY